MAKNDSTVKLDSEGMPFIPGFSDVKGVEMDLGKLFFKPRILNQQMKNPICQGYAWNLQEFPNHVNEDTGEIMRAGIIKLTKESPVVNNNGEMVTRAFGQEIYLPLNHAIRDLEQIFELKEVCHEIIIVATGETPLAAGKDKKPKTMHGFRWKIVNANVNRDEVLKTCVPEKLKQFVLAQGNGVKAPSLPART